MAVPARRTSKAKKNKRRTHYKVTAPSVNFDEATGDYSRSHRVSLKGYYKGRKIAKANVNITLEHKESGERLYLTSKNKRNTPDRLQLKKYSPKLRKHVVFTEVK